MSLPWYDKHAPKSTSEIIGQGIQKVLKCVNEKKPCLIVGPPGTGKTASAYAIAKECGMQLIELSVDEKRNAEYINSVLRNTILTRGFFGEKLVLIDDVDLLDRGGMPELIKCVKMSKVAIIFTAKDKWDQKLRSLNNYCEIIEYRKLRAAWIAKILRKICSKENVKVSDGLLYKIAANAKGDARAAINDLELLGKDGEITDYEFEALTYREKPISIFEGLSRLYNAKDFNEALKALDDVEMDINEKLLWISENASLVKDLKELSEIYNYLSRADVFIGRVLRWQHYRYWAYANALMTGGVKTKTPCYKFNSPKKILKLWKTKSDRASRNRVLEALRTKIHASKRKLMNEYLPYLKIMCKNNDFKNMLINELDLNPKDIDFL